MDKRVLLLPLALGLLACAATQGGTGPRRSASVLTADEIVEAGVTTAYQAVELLRPQWLTTRASPTRANMNTAPPMLYLDGIRLNDFRELQRIRASEVERMEFLRPSDATNRFGTNHDGGAILITTR